MHQGVSKRGQKFLHGAAQSKVARRVIIRRFYATLLGKNSASLAQTMPKAMPNAENAVENSRQCGQSGMASLKMYQSFAMRIYNMDIACILYQV